LIIIPLAVLMGFALSFLGFHAWQRLQPAGEGLATEATPGPLATPPADVTPTPVPPGPFGLPFRPPEVTLPFSIPVRATLPFSPAVSAPRLPFVGGEAGPTSLGSPSPSPSPPALPAPGIARATPTPRPTAAPTRTPTVVLTASRATRQYAERVARSLEQLAQARQRYAALRYTWRPGSGQAEMGRTALDLHDLARTADAQARALEQPQPPPGMEGLARSASAAWAALAQASEQYACVVLSDGRDRGCLQRANEAQSHAREAAHQASVALAQAASVVQRPTPTATPNLGDYWAAVAPRLEEMRNASDVVTVVMNAHARGEADNQELCRLPAYLATFTQGQALAPLVPPAGWEGFHAAFVAWMTRYAEGLTAVARFCGTVQVATPTPTAQARATPAPPPASPDLEEARRSFIAANAERDRFEGLLANPPAGVAPSTAG
jgi:hypothetical protein